MLILLLLVLKLNRYKWKPLRVPKYYYRCKTCNRAFEVIHSITEKLCDCDKCLTSGSLNREPYTPMVLKTSSVNPDDSTTAGQRVRAFIEESRQDLEGQRHEINKGNQVPEEKK